MTIGRSSYPPRAIVAGRVSGPIGTLPLPLHLESSTPMMDTITISETDDMPRDWTPLTLENPHDGAPTIVTDDEGERYLIVTPQYSRSAFVCDDDEFAVYTTNRDAAADAFGLERFAPMRAGDRWWLTVPILDDDDETESVDILADLTRALADYPLLDESAYDERDAAAWLECWSGWARREVERSMLAELEPYLTADPYDVADLLESAPWDAAAQESMDHWRGLSGEYDQDGATAGALAMLAAMGELFATMSTIGRIYSGVIPLPLPLPR